VPPMGLRFFLIAAIATAAAAIGCGASGPPAPGTVLTSHVYSVAQLPPDGGRGPDGPAGCIIICASEPESNVSACGECNFETLPDGGPAVLCEAIQCESPDAGIPPL
jgi:hypothetical protein